MNDKQLAWHRLAGEMYAIIETRFKSSTILGIFPSQNIAILNFKQMYYNKQHSFSTNAYYTLKELKLFEHQSNWKLIQDDLQKILPQKKRRKYLNDENLQNRLYHFLKENKCRAYMLKDKDGTIYERVDCFGVRNYYQRGNRIRYCKLHNCTYAKCNCNELMDEFYEMIEKEGINPFYYELDTIY